MSNNESGKQRPVKLGTLQKPENHVLQTKSSRSASLSPKRVVNGVGFTLASKPKMRSASQVRVPPKKVEIGIAPPPNIAEVKSRIGSMDNVKHKPQGGNVKVETQKLDWSANSRVGSMQNANYRPGGGEKKIMTQKVLISAQSKIGSLDNATHKPGGGNVKVESRKLDFKEKARSKVGSMDNVKHVPGGGNIQIFDQKYATSCTKTKRISSPCSDTSNEKRSLPQTPTTQTEQ
ncbi:microtubule-associated protein tau-like isoform X2 [Varroa jacobsoni]|uniref:Microtubule-associated protein n=1 Tax=Varroa destructor TaxID=109461 RepID=A0A7M7MCI3_VARDE|nr:microtubule-associated protein tau-like isoform X2 [Varroa destructor]XP_022686166.1 microtubule-associated protein tau-like isoform X2 [Varroa jacobsoni]